MKKSSFAALVLGTVSGVLFALGMCMALLPEWNSFLPGVIFGSVGVVLGIVTVIVWRRMENKAPIRVSGRTLMFIALGILGALTMGVGMCLCMVWNRMVIGVPVGLVGIVMLIGLIPLYKGIQ
ncbi:MAG: hypothetical protein IJO98_06185 [Clostridia bacterium]|nr:hypothetical protein [Clostridia bacterium]